MLKPVPLKGTSNIEIYFNVERFRSKIVKIQEKTNFRSISETS